jgi:hypothetical protein
MHIINCYLHDNGFKFEKLYSQMHWTPLHEGPKATPNLTYPAVFKSVNSALREGWLLVRSLSFWFLVAQGWSATTLDSSYAIVAFKMHQKI